MKAFVNVTSMKAFVELLTLKLHGSFRGIFRGSYFQDNSVEASITSMNDSLET